MLAIVESTSSLIDRSGSDFRRLEISVVFTDVATTRCAVETVRRLAQGFPARISILVPQVIPYPLPLDQPAVPVSFTREALRKIFESEDAELSLTVFLCRDRMEAIRAAVPAGSLLAIGAASRHWWNSAARLSRRLERSGYRVILIEASTISRMPLQLSDYGTADSHA